MYAIVITTTKTKPLIASLITEVWIDSAFAELVIPPLYIRSICASPHPLLYYASVAMH